MTVDYFRKHSFGGKKDWRKLGRGGGSVRLLFTQTIRARIPLKSKISNVNQLQDKNEKEAEIKNIDVSLNLALGQVTLCYGQKTVGWRSSHMLLAVGRNLWLREDTVGNILKALQS